MYILVLLNFTPLEFETKAGLACPRPSSLLNFTPLEFETKARQAAK